MKTQDSNTSAYENIPMSTQISLKLSDVMLAKAKARSKERGFDSLQEFIRETLRRTLFEEEPFGGKYTYLASEASLARNWMNEKEDEAWAHLQKAT